MSSDFVTLVLHTAIPLIKLFEGFRSKPYLCTANVPTIGWGSTYYLDGKRVTLKDPPISVELADKLLMNTIEKTYLPATLRNCPTLKTSNRAAAILSWVYNLGESNLRSSTMRRKILQELWKEVPAEILKWNRSGGVVTRGLVNRRQAEANMFRRDE